MKRQKFLGKLKAEHRMIGFKNLIYVDETGFDAHCNRGSAWVTKGQKILGLVSGKRKRRTNLIMAQRHGRKGYKKEWLAPMLFQGSCNSLCLIINANYYNHRGSCDKRSYHSSHTIADAAHGMKGRGHAQSIAVGEL